MWENVWKNVQKQALSEFMCVSLGNLCKRRKRAAERASAAALDPPRGRLLRYIDACIRYDLERYKRSAAHFGDGGSDMAVRGRPCPPSDRNCYSLANGKIWSRRGRTGTDEQDEKVISTAFVF